MKKRIILVKNIKIITLLLGILFQFTVFIFVLGTGVSCWGNNGPTGSTIIGGGGTFNGGGGGAHGPQGAGGGGGGGPHGAGGGGGGGGDKALVACKDDLRFGLLESLLC